MELLCGWPLVAMVGFTKQLTRMRSFIDVLNTSLRPKFSWLVLVLMSNVLAMVGIEQNLDKGGKCKLLSFHT